MTQNYTETEVSCGVCHKALKDDEIRFLWSDTDWLEHGDHYASITADQEQAYYAKAKELSR